jgi:histidinol-phosphate aminotransferase
MSGAGPGRDGGADRDETARPRYNEPITRQKGKPDMIEPREAVTHLHPYRPGRPADLSAPPDVNLAANENAWGPSPRVLAAVGRAGTWARYPDMAGAALLRRLALRWEVPEDHMLLGTGSGHLIKCLTETYVRPGDTVAVVFPTFSLYAQGAGLMGGTVAVWSGDGHRVDFSGLPQWLHTIKPRVTFLCSPNNPTGDAAAPETVAEMAAIMSSDGLLVVDEAYIHFAESGWSALELVRDGRAVAVLRTFSKAYGLAAARLGVLIAPPAVIDAVGRVREPFPVSPMALAAAEAAVEDTAYLERIVRLVREGRSRLERELTQRGWDVNPSQANFVWARPSARWDAPRWRELLLAEGVLVRDGGGFGVPDHLRITVGTDHEVTRFLTAVDRLEAMHHGGGHPVSV